MNALPMLARCARRQWAGLTAHDRARVKTCWRSGDGDLAALQAGKIETTSVVLWGATIGRHRHCCMDIREERMAE